MARRTFDVLDVTEVLVHWYAGRSKVELSASLGMDRKTVRKYVAPAEAEGLRPGGPPVPRAVWAERVRAWFPELTDTRLRQPTWPDIARHHDYIASMLGIVSVSTIYQVLRDEHGLQASEASLRRYIQTLPRRPKVCLPPPGSQARVDYGYLGTWERRKVWAFVMVLPASRHMFAYPVLAMDHQVWAAAHVAAFTFFGGVPARLIPADPRTARPGLYDPRINRLYGDLGVHFGTLIDPARAVRSGVDRQLPYLRDSFWRDKEFSSVGDMREAASVWCRVVAGRRSFGTSTPIEVFTSIEAPVLGPLPAAEFAMATWSVAKVGPDGFAKVGRACYSLPWRFLGLTLDVRQTDAIVEFYQQDLLVKTHVRRPRGKQADPADHPLPTCSGVRDRRAHASLKHMTLRARVRAIVDDDRFQRVIIAVIVINSVTLGCETSSALVAEHGELLAGIDHVALGIFVVELVARLYAYRLSFFRDAWNCFDFLVVGISLLPAGGALSVVRSLRILRALRLISMVPSMRRVVSALLRAIPGMVSLSALLVLMLYVGGVMASNLFGASGDPGFNNLGSTILSLFQITTGDGWSDIMRDLMQQHPLAWIFFVCYLLVGTFTMLNLFIAVVCSAMEPEIQQSKPVVPEQRTGEPDLSSVMAELKALRSQVESLQPRS